MLTKLATITAGLLSTAVSPTFARPSPSPNTPDTASHLLDSRDAAPGGPARLSKRSYSGMATYYDTQTGNQGSCGDWLSNSDFIVAMDSRTMQDSYCGRQIWISYNGNTQYATVRDTCPSCVSSGSLDLSPSLFKAFASEDVGTFSMTWDFVGNNQPATTSSTPAYTAPTSTWVAPTTSTSQWVAPTTSTTPAYTSPTTSYTPTSTYTPPSSTWVAPSSSSTSTWVAPSSSSTSSSSSSSSSSASSTTSSIASTSLITTLSGYTASRTVTAVLSTAIGDAILSTASTSAPVSTSTATTSSGSGDDGTETVGSSTGGNLETLSQVIVNLGRFVVVNAAAA